MPITAEYDAEADALYVRLKDGERANTVEVDDATYVDVDADGRLLGVELLYPSLGINLEGVARMFGGLPIGEHQQASTIATTIARMAAPAAVPTVTLDPEPIMTMSVEGTIAAAHDFATPSVAHADPLIVVVGE